MAEIEMPVPKSPGIAAHAYEFWVSKQGLNETGTVGITGTPSVWNCNLDDLFHSHPDCGLGPTRQ